MSVELCMRMSLASHTIFLARSFSVRNAKQIGYGW